MEYRYLGNSGFKVNSLIYGNWITHVSQVSNDAAIATVHAALDGGITSFDTADVYANLAAEEVLGQALRGQRREGLEIFSKVYWPVADRKPNDTGLSRKHIMESINGSLKRLETDYLDLYMAHRFDYETPLEETMLAFADIVRSGKALYIGVSEWTADQIRAGAALARELKVPFISNQPQYSMLWRIIEGEVIPASQENGMSQIVWSPMAQGVLTGKYLPGKAFPAGSRGADEKLAYSMQGFLRDEVLTKVQLLKPIAEELGVTMAQLALAWVLHRPNITAAIVGATSPEQIKSNLGAVGVTIPQELMEKIDAVLAGVVETDPALSTESPLQRLV